MINLRKRTSQLKKVNGSYTDQLDCLIDLAVVLGQQNNFGEELRLVVQNAASLMDAEIALIMMINPRTHETVKTIYVEGEEKNEKDYHYFHVNLSGWVIKNGRGFVSQNLSEDIRFHKQLFSKSQLKSAICIPFKVEGLIIGTLLLMNKSKKEAFREEDLVFMEKFAAITAPFLRNTQKLQKYFLRQLPQNSLLKKYSAFGLLGKCPKFIELLNAIEAAARTDVRILLEGQSGTGKELIAKAIHHLSSRNENKFIAIDCGAIPANLMESELFGHVRGAFTGASKDRMGLLEEANKGTLFMDEISNLSLELQAKMLRVLQEGEIRPLGSNNSRAIDVRIISASSISLKKLVEKQQFREDLFYRLHVYPINVPSLNDRKEDIPILAINFLKKFAATQNKKAELFHEEVLDFMMQRKWHGNIRELENLVERLVTLAPSDVAVLDRDALPSEYQKEFKKLTVADEEHPIRKSLQAILEEHEEKVIRQALQENQWNQSKTARSLQVSEQTIRYKMAKFGIVKPL